MYIKYKEIGNQLFPRERGEASRGLGNILCRPEGRMAIGKKEERNTKRIR